MKSKRFVDLLVALVIALPILSILVALATTPDSRFSWQALAQDAYSDPAPTQVGVVPQENNVIVEPRADGSINIVSFGADGKSVASLDISALELADLPVQPEENILISQTEDRFAQLYKLTTGEYQANIGPDSEGKIFVYVFTVDPPECVSRYEISTSDPTPRFQGPC
jgi:hypothetical protein